MDKASGKTAVTTSIAPAACIFLERNGATAPRLIPLSGVELTQRIQRARPCKEDAASHKRGQAVFAALGKLPAYRLLYGSDPAVAARFYASVLKMHRSLEARQ